MTTEIKAFDDAPHIIRDINSLGYLRNWSETKGIISVEFNNLHSHLNKVIIQRKRIGIGDNIWSFAFALPVIGPDHMKNDEEFNKKLKMPDAKADQKQNSLKEYV